MYVYFSLHEHDYSQCMKMSISLYSKKVDNRNETHPYSRFA
jgi:hypothetical protein